MSKRTINILLVLSLVFNQAYGQAFKQEFNYLTAKKDTLGQQQLLAKWEKADSNDPELYVAFFNYFARNSKREIIRMDNNPTGEDGLKIMDKDSSNKEPVAFMYSDTYYDQSVLQKGFDYIDKGIERHPNRLDMRFGKIYMFGQINNYEKFTTEIINAINYSAINNNKWTWADNKPLENPKSFFLSAIQDYQAQLYNTESDDLLVYMKRIAETVLQYYPEHIESLSNLSIFYMLQKQYNKALEQLLKAEKINPKDIVVLNNIAEANKRKGDKKNAIKYYGLIIKYGNEEDQKYAVEQIDELKKK